MFIDAQLKVKDESGRLIEFFDREINVVKAFLKLMLPTNYHDDIDTLSVDVMITPFTISDEKDEIEKLISASGGKALLSQREAIERLGWSNNTDETLKEILAESGGAVNL